MLVVLSAADGSAARVRENIAGLKVSACINMPNVSPIMAAQAMVQRPIHASCVRRSTLLATKLLDPEGRPGQVGRRK